MLFTSEEGKLSQQKRGVSEPRIAMASPGATSLRTLSTEFKALQREPVEGFRVTIPNDSDFYTWQVAIFGPPDTPYQSGYFKVRLVAGYRTVVSVWGIAYLDTHFLVTIYNNQRRPFPPPPPPFRQR